MSKNAQLVFLIFFFAAALFFGYRVGVTFHEQRFWMMAFNAYFFVYEIVWLRRSIRAYRHFRDEEKEDLP